MGSLFGGGSTTTTVKESNEPPKWAAPLFTQSARDAQNLYNSGAGFNIWPGSTTAAPSDMTVRGTNALEDVAMSPDSTTLAQNPVNLTNQVLSQGGLMAPAQQAMGFFGNVASGGMNPSVQPFQTALGAANNPYMQQAAGLFTQAAGNNTPGASLLSNVMDGNLRVDTIDGLSNVRGKSNKIHGYRADDMFNPFISGQVGINTRGDFSDIYGRAQHPGAAEDYLTTTARGDYLAEGNPYFRELLTKEAERLGDQISGLFSGSGRYGSGAHQGVLGETVGDFTLKGLSDDFSRERGLQVDAAQMIETAQQGRLGQQLGAVAGMTGVDAQNVANRLAATNDLQGVRERGIGNELGILDQVANIQQQNIQNRMGAADQLNNNAFLGASGLAGLGQSLFSNLLGGAQGLYGAQNLNLQNQMNAAQNAGNLSNQGLNNALGFINALPTVQQNRTFAPNLMLQSGAQQDQYNQSLINDMIRRFHEQDMQPWTRLGALQAAAAGSAGPYGMMHQSSKTPNNSGGLGGFLGNVFGLISGMPGMGGGV